MSAPDRPTRDLLGELQASLEAARRPAREQQDAAPARYTRALVDEALVHADDLADWSAKVDRQVLAAEVRALRADLEVEVRASNNWQQIADERRAALVARTPQPAEPAQCSSCDGTEWACYACQAPHEGWLYEAPRVPLPAVPDGPGAHVGAEASGVLWMAMRYALGRATYAVQEVGSAIAQHAHHLAPWQRERMAQEIERELGYDTDGAAWGSDAATWRQAISDLRAPLLAVPDGEDAAIADRARHLDRYYGLWVLDDKPWDEMSHEEAYKRGQVFATRYIARHDMSPATVDGEAVPARLDDAADACANLRETPVSREAGALLRRLASWLKHADAVDARAVVAAALARPTEQQK